MRRETPLPEAENNLGILMTPFFVRIVLVSLLTMTGLQSAPTSFWSDPNIVGDSMFFIKADDAAPPKASLLRVPTDDPELRSCTQQVKYEMGRDFTWEPGSREIVLTPNSRIPFKTVAELHPAPGSPNSYDGFRGTNLHMLYSQGRFFHDLQCEASYASKEAFPGPVPPAATRELSRVRSRLLAKQPVKIVMLGDSISTGLNASLTGAAPPLLPGYPEQVAKILEERTEAPVTIKNLSVSGMGSGWGLQQMPAVIAEAPDLFLLAFGMNDASGHDTPANFVNTLRKTLDALHEGWPECDAIVISPMTANSEWKHAVPELYPAYAAEMKKLVGPGCALADVTTVWLALMERKTHLDLSGNGLNHPNDFGHRLYAAIVLATMGDLSKP